MLFCNVSLQQGDFINGVSQISGSAFSWNVSSSHLCKTTPLIIVAQFAICIAAIEANRFSPFLPRFVDDPFDNLLANVLASHLVACS